MFPILPRSPESLSSSLICSKNTMPKKKKKNDLACYGYAYLKFANNTYLRAPDYKYQNSYDRRKVRSSFNLKSNPRRSLSSTSELED